jgi:hypothetical protein
LVSDGSHFSEDVFQLLKIEQIKKIDNDLKKIEENLLIVQNDIKKINELFNGNFNEIELNSKLDIFLTKKKNLEKDKIIKQKEKISYETFFFHLYDYIHLLKNMRNNVKNYILYHKNNNDGFLLRKLSELIMDVNPNICNFSL